MDKTTAIIVEKLQSYKNEGRKYYEATQKLREDGYNDEQIGRANHYFTYSDIKNVGDTSGKAVLPPDANAAFATAVMHEQTTDHLRTEKNEALAKGLLFGKYLPWYNFMAYTAWVNHKAATSGKPKAAIYRVTVAAAIACTALIPLAGTIVIMSGLPAYFIPVFFVVGLLLILRLVKTYLNK
jgi:hypothetical protein